MSIISLKNFFQWYWRYHEFQITMNHIHDSISIRYICEISSIFKAMRNRRYRHEYHIIEWKFYLDENHYVKYKWISWFFNRFDRRSWSTNEFSVNKKVTTCSEIIEDKSIHGRTTMTSSSLKRIWSLRKNSSYMNDIKFSLWRINRILIQKSPKSRENAKNDRTDEKNR